MNRSTGLILAIGGSGLLLLLILYMSLLEKNEQVGPVLAAVRSLRMLFQNNTLILRRTPDPDGDALSVVYERRGIPAGEPTPDDEDEAPIACFLFQTWRPDDGSGPKSVAVTCRYVEGGACSRRQVDATFRMTREEYRKWQRGGK